MTTLFKGLSVATEIMIKNQYVEILTYKKNFYIDTISISRVLDVLYKDLIKHIEEDMSLYSFETNVQGFCYKIYALNINQTSSLLKKLNTSLSDSKAIMDTFKTLNNIKNIKIIEKP